MHFKLLLSYTVPENNANAVTCHSIIKYQATDAKMSQECLTAQEEVIHDAFTPSTQRQGTTQHFLQQIVHAWLFNMIILSTASSTRDQSLFHQSLSIKAISTEFIFFLTYPILIFKKIVCSLSSIEEEHDSHKLYEAYLTWIRLDFMNN